MLFIHKMLLRNAHLQYSRKKGRMSLYFANKLFKKFNSDDLF